MFGYSVHADGAEYYTDNEFCVWSLQSVHSHGASVWDSKFPMLQIPHAEMHDPEVRKAVNKEIARFLKWIDDIMFSGEWPDAGFCMRGNTDQSLCTQCIYDPCRWHGSPP